MNPQPALQSTSSEPNEPIKGSPEPRIWTPPLRELTPATSYGFDVIDFADQIIGTPLDPWQQNAIISAGELLPDGRPRFRTVLILVARQNGKTYLSKVLTLYWMAIEEAPLILATSTDRSYAKAAWKEVIDIAESNPHLKNLVKKRLQTGEENLAIGNSNYTFAASNRRAGRSLTVHRLIIDEIREHTTTDAWGAATKAMQAVPEAQAFCISNQGDENSLILNNLRDSAISHIETGQGDPRLGLFEWSAPKGCDPTDPNAIAAANPDLGNRIQLDSLIGDARRAKQAGGEELASFRTEVLCQQVTMMDAAIDEHIWLACANPNPPDLKKLGKPIHLCIDVSPDNRHATLAAAVTHQNTTHIEIVEAWDDWQAASKAKNDLPKLIKNIKPATLSWYPNGPTAAIAAELTTLNLPKKTKLTPITSELAAVCMGLEEQAQDKAIKHNSDPLLNRHITLAQRKQRGDAWTFTRSDNNPVDAAYSAAGAVHQARIADPPKPKLVVL